MWNPWHGCTKVSAGCQNCYMFRRDSKYGIDSTFVHKTASFRLPVQKNRKGEYKIPSGSTVFTCFTSDFFHEAADEWRPEAWSMIKERSDCHFYMITKRPGVNAVNISSSARANYPGCGVMVFHSPVPGVINLLLKYRLRSALSLVL